MTLDLTQVSRLVAAMGKEIAESLPREAEQLAEAVAALRKHAQDYEAINERLGKFVGLAAGLVEPLDRRVPLPEVLHEYTIIASDGSLVEPERHGIAYYYLLNIGTAILRYGREPKAALNSYASLGYRPEDLYIAAGDKELALEGGVLRVKRAVAETEQLGQLLLGQEREGPMLGLQDGTLIPWLPEGHGPDQPELRKALLDPLSKTLDELRAAGIAIASYISRPRTHEVVNALRAAICPYNPVDCRNRCPNRGPRHPAPCDVISEVSDRRLLGVLPLSEGERSALFYSRSRVLEQYRSDRVYFCYLNVGAEIARLEMPEWVATDQAKCDLVHVIAYDQCRRGGGYPRALTEAHEKAVIAMADRQQCERLVETALARNNVQVSVSMKQQSKRLRGV